MKQKPVKKVVATANEDMSGNSFEKLTAELKKLLPVSLATTKSKSNHIELPAPYGYDFPIPNVTESEREGPDASLIVKRSWDIATAPFKALPQMLIMMWMSGNQLSIWSIMMVGYMVFRPIKSLFSVFQMFEKIQGDQAVVQKLVYFLGELTGCVLGLYKIQMMGLLPLNPSDWAANEEAPEWLENCYGPTSFV